VEAELAVGADSRSGDGLPAPCTDLGAFGACVLVLTSVTTEVEASLAGLIGAGLGRGRVRSFASAVRALTHAPGLAGRSRREGCLGLRPFSEFHFHPAVLARGRQPLRLFLHSNYHNGGIKDCSDSAGRSSVLQLPTIYADCSSCKASTPTANYQVADHFCALQGN